MNASRPTPMTTTDDSADPGSTVSPPRGSGRRCPTVPAIGVVLPALLAALLAGCTGGGPNGETAVPTAASPPAATDPLAVATPPPDYPLALACAGVGGEVVLVLALDDKGIPAEVRIENSSRQSALDAAAIAAVRTWRFRPATSRGQPVPTRIRVPVKFTPPVMRPDRCFGLDEQQQRSG